MGAFSLIVVINLLNRVRMANRETLCDICLKAQASYKCPKCSWSYCSLQCYKSEKHSDCSESFYRNEVMEALKGKKCPGREQMTELLDEIARLDVGSVDGLTESCNGESRVIDMDSENLYDQLDEKEKQAFDDLLRNNKGALIFDPIVPWWTDDKTSEIAPEIAEADDFLKLCSKAPSDTLYCRFLNISFIYAFSYRLFNADFFDLPDEVINLLSLLMLTFAFGPRFTKSKIYRSLIKLWFL